MLFPDVLNKCDAVDFSECRFKQVIRFFWPGASILFFGLGGKSKKNSKIFGYNVKFLRAKHAAKFKIVCV